MVVLLHLHECKYAKVGVRTHFDVLRPQVYSLNINHVGLKLKISFVGHEL